MNKVEPPIINLRQLKTYGDRLSIATDWATKARPHIKAVKNKNKFLI